ncbi:hypothetical protein [Myroides sp. N17-2]|uniref:hypothetical protein n=1 Tax=Myroides sp. N17-2 TaxID=2030799 RepID=UPI000EFC58E5|nr:hypothetical protein [Myroides sp. N17-2]
MKMFITVIALGVVFGSCSSSTKLAENSSEFKNEYQKSLAEYNKSVSPQIYNNHNSPIVKNDGTLLKTTKTATQE